MRLNQREREILAELCEFQPGHGPCLSKYSNRFAQKMVSRGIAEIVGKGEDRWILRASDLGRAVLGVYARRSA